jgi:hypothetical protein
MRNLLDLIRGERHRRAVGHEFFVVKIRQFFCGNGPPSARLGDNLFEKGPDESYEVFAERIAAAAKAAGLNFIVINIPEPRSDGVRVSHPRGANEGRWNRCQL